MQYVILGEEGVHWLLIDTTLDINSEVYWMY